MLHGFDRLGIWDQRFEGKCLVVRDPRQQDRECVRHGQAHPVNTTVASSLMCSSIRARTTAFSDTA